jgi:hypothetical protein
MVGKNESTKISYSTITYLYKPTFMSRNDY